MTLPLTNVIGYFLGDEYRILYFKRRGAYLILGLSSAAFISNAKIEGDELMCQF